MSKYKKCTKIIYFCLCLIQISIDYGKYVFLTWTYSCNILNLLIYSNYTPVYNFIYDIFAAKSAALKPLSQHLILCTFRYFLRKWQKYLAADILTYLKKKILYTFGMVLDKLFILIRQNIHITIIDMKSCKVVITIKTIIKLCFT